jgi:hypothetical protein
MIVSIIVAIQSTHLLVHVNPEAIAVRSVSHRDASAKAIIPVIGVIFFNGQVFKSVLYGYFL